MKAHNVRLPLEVAVDRATAGKQSLWDVDEATMKDLEAAALKQVGADGHAFKMRGKLDDLNISIKILLNRLFESGYINSAGRLGGGETQYILTPLGEKALAAVKK